jgi:hypothetical protein
MNLKKISTLLLALTLIASSASSIVAPVNTPKTLAMSRACSAQALSPLAVAGVRYGGALLRGSVLSPRIQHMAALTVIAAGISIAAQNPFIPFTTVQDAADANARAVQLENAANKAFLSATAEDQEALTNLFPQVETAVDKALENWDEMAIPSDPLGVGPALLLGAEQRLNAKMNDVPKAPASEPETSLKKNLTKGLKRFLSRRSPQEKLFLLGDKRELLLLIIDRIPSMQWAHTGLKTASRIAFIPRKGVLARPRASQVEAAFYVAAGGDVEVLYKNYKEDQDATGILNENTSTVLSYERKLHQAERDLRDLHINKMAAYQRFANLRSEAIAAYDVHAVAPAEDRVHPEKAYRRARNAQEELLASLPYEENSAIKNWMHLKIELTIAKARQEYEERKLADAENKLGDEKRLAQSLFDRKSKAQTPTFIDFSTTKNESAIEHLITQQKKLIKERREQRRAQKRLERENNIPPAIAVHWYREYPALFISKFFNHHPSNPIRTPLGGAA